MTKEGGGEGEGGQAGNALCPLFPLKHPGPALGWPFLRQMIEFFNSPFTKEDICRRAHFQASPLRRPQALFQASVNLSLGGLLANDQTSNFSELTIMSLCLLEWARSTSGWQACRRGEDLGSDFRWSSIVHRSLRRLWKVEGDPSPRLMSSTTNTELAGTASQATVSLRGMVEELPKWGR